MIKAKKDVAIKMNIQVPNVLCLDLIIVNLLSSFHNTKIYDIT